MHRENLIAAVEIAARECKLSFKTGYEYQMNEIIREMPVLWLDPLIAIKSEGLKEGIKTYSLKMTLIELPDRDGASNPELIWRQMEDKASAICLTIARAECVKSTSSVELSASKNSITNRGEISMSIKMSVEVPFTRN